jgi:Ca2+-binding RTX toxin-like protein
LTGGAGSDVFIFESGKDVITDYAAGSDKIQMNLDAVTAQTVSGSNVVLTTDEGTLTINKAKDKVITFIDENGNKTDRIYYQDTYYSLNYNSAKTMLTASSIFGGAEIDLSNTQKYLGTVEKVNTTAATTDLKIVGNAKDNLLNSGAGNDVFIYEGGNDVITDYAAGEEIRISGEISESITSGKDIIYTIGDGSLTVKNAKTKNVNIQKEIRTNTIDLLYDVNFMSEEIGLDDITEKKFELTQIADTNNDSVGSGVSIASASNFDK